MGTAKGKKENEKERRTFRKTHIRGRNVKTRQLKKYMYMYMQRDRQTNRYTLIVTSRCVENDCGV